MKQSVSWYMMPGDTDEELLAKTRALGLDGIENLVYGTAPGKEPAPQSTVGCHLNFWPTWMDFYLGNTEYVKKEFPTEESLVKTFGAATPEGWLETIRKNIRAALAEKPAYLVWHVADCTNEETWTGKFHYSSREVLRATAGLYKKIRDAIPSDVYFLFENIFWPGLNLMHPEEAEEFFSLVKAPNVGMMLDTGHLMNMNPDLATEEEGVDYICSVVQSLGKVRPLIKGIHLSCSLSGAYQKSAFGRAPERITPLLVGQHVHAIDQHRPFTSPAARRIIETVRPRFVTHELFGSTEAEIIRKVRTQQHAAGLG